MVNRHSLPTPLLFITHCRWPSSISQFHIFMDSCSLKSRASTIYRVMHRIVAFSAIPDSITDLWSFSALCSLSSSIKVSWWVVHRSFRHLHFVTFKMSKFTWCHIWTWTWCLRHNLSLPEVIATLIRHHFPSSIIFKTGKQVFTTGIICGIVGTWWWNSISMSDFILEFTKSFFTWTPCSCFRIFNGWYIIYTILINFDNITICAWSWNVLFYFDVRRFYKDCNRWLV